MRRRAWTRIALAACLGVALAGCAGTSGPHLLTYPGAHNGDLARAAGRLAREGNCLYIESDGPRYLLALPTDASWDEKRDAVVFDGVRYTVGTDVAVGGSAIDYHDASLTMPGIWATPAASDCDTSLVWLTGGMSLVAPAETAPPSATTTVLSSDAALEQDAREYAKDYGVSLDQARAALITQAAPGPTGAALNDAVPGRLAGVWVEHLPAFHVVAWFTGGDDGLDAAHQVAADAPVPVEIRMGASHTLAELERLRAQAAALAPRDALSGSTVVVQDGSIELDFQPGLLEPGEQDALAARISAAVGAPVHVVVTAHVAGDD